ncbi:probable serine/threonine-protein kinase DDB_G0280133 [Xenia sp. Carnegie-2017]|uniref:probable serine/threonine-protein kinase DDB_G0280133 n=1 Tax=Xenia sp. Carnegie-2017 TaxID=2897299 RepID=UPI001F0432E9|nr:probable serine/threonine-protein kinase DDB_G0280133 [Xenia sp. Carnegie-2017]
MIYKDLTKNCLVLTGVFLIIIGAISIVLSLILEHHSYSLSADRRIYATQYWLGIPIIVLGLVVSCFSSSLQRKQRTMLMCVFVCLPLLTCSLVAIILHCIAYNYLKYESRDASSVVMNLHAALMVLSAITYTLLLEILVIEILHVFHFVHEHQLQVRERNLANDNQELSLGTSSSSEDSHVPQHPSVSSSTLIEPRPPSYESIFARSQSGLTSHVTTNRGNDSRNVNNTARVTYQGESNYMVQYGRDVVGRDNVAVVVDSDEEITGDIALNEENNHVILPSAENVSESNQRDEQVVSDNVNLDHDFSRNLGVLSNDNTDNRLANFEDRYMVEINELNDTGSHSGQLSNDTAGPPEQITNDTGSHSGQLSNDTAGPPEQVNGTGSHSGQISNDTASHSEHLSNDTAGPPEQVRNDTGSYSGQLSNDTAGPPEQVTNDTGSHSGQLSNDTAAPPEQVTNDIGSHSRQLSNDTASHSEHLSNDTAGPPEQVRNDIGSLSGQISNDTASPSEQASNDADSPSEQQLETVMKLQGSFV